MDQQFINILFEVFMGIMAVLGAIAGWVLNSIYSSIKELQDKDSKLSDKIAEIDKIVAGDYVKRSYLDERAKEIFALLSKMQDKNDKIFEILANKADK